MYLEYYLWEVRDWHNSCSVNRFFDLVVSSVENAATHRCEVKKGR